MSVSDPEIAQAEGYLLYLRGVTLTGPVLESRLCQAVIARQETLVLAGPDTAARLCAKLLQPYSKAMTDDMRKKAVVFADDLAAMSLPAATNLVAVMAKNGALFPAAKEMSKFKMMAEARGVQLLGLAKAHLKESQRRDKAAAETERVEADRQAMTSEERKQFVESKLKAAGFR